MRIIAWRYVCILRHPTLKICLRWIRIPIFALDRIIFELPPEPDPPWFGGEGIRPELAHDLKVLATIDVLAQTLSDGHKKATLEFVQTQFDALKLPEGLAITTDRDLQQGAKSS